MTQEQTLAVMGIHSFIDWGSCWASSFFSLGYGLRVQSNLAARPAQTLHLYDIEGCAECRLVRETLTDLDLDAVLYPCPKGGQRFRSRALEIGGREMFPLLVDPNLGRAVYGARAIIAMLQQHYGRGVPTVPVPWRKATAVLGHMVRFGAGRYARPSRRPELMLELYNVETEPDCRRVREQLCELEVSYLLHSVGYPCWEKRLLSHLQHKRGQSVQRDRWLAAQNTPVRPPVLVDPNRGETICGSPAILSYLTHHYAV
ncbi:glutathione S-transferase N-terminal domain-containing protein [Marinobacteraceae bacterium S3BR75-40.1]